MADPQLDLDISKNFLYPHVLKNTTEADPDVDHFYAMRGGNGNHTSLSPYTAPWNLSMPSWEFTHHSPVQGYQGPVIDSRGNIYVPVFPHTLTSLTQSGFLRWTVQLPEQEGDRDRGHISQPLLLGRFLYVTDGYALLYKLSLATGETQWYMRYTWDVEPEGNSAVFGSRGTLVLTGACSQRLQSFCKSYIIAIEARSGRILWKNMYGPRDWTIAGNKDIVVTENELIIQTSDARIVCLNLIDGTWRWTRSVRMPDVGDSWAVGGPMVGPNNLVYGVTVNFQRKRDRGFLRAFDVQHGGAVWEQAFDEPVQNPCSMLRVGGRLVLIVPVGKRAAQERLAGSVVALDAKNGSRLWSFEPPAATPRRCLPNHWSGASVSADGVVYIGRVDGVLYALNGTNGAVLSTVALGAAIAQNPAIAPGMLVVTACHKTFAYREPVAAAVRDLPPLQVPVRP